MSQLLSICKQLNRQLLTICKQLTWHSIERPTVRLLRTIAAITTGVQIVPHMESSCAAQLHYDHLAEFSKTILILRVASAQRHLFVAFIVDLSIM